MSNKEQELLNPELKGCPCESCVNVKRDVLGADEYGAGSGIIYCSKRHWDGSPEEIEHEMPKDAWKDCNDHRPAQPESKVIAEDYTGLCIGLREGKEVFFRTAADVIELLQAEKGCLNLSNRAFRGDFKEQERHLKDLRKQIASSQAELQDINKLVGGKPEHDCVSDSVKSELSAQKALIAVRGKEAEKLKAREASLVAALEYDKKNSYPGLAVKEGTLLNRIYKNSTQALAQEPASPWISVEDRLPEVEKELLLITYAGAKSVGFLAGVTGKWWSDENHWNEKPTHWMPIPTLPKTEVTE